MVRRVTPAAQVLIVALAGLCAAAGQAAAAAPGQAGGLPARWLPVDREGWTVFTPSPDTRLIYVSSSAGNDATATWYAPGAAEVGADPFRPTDHVRPFRTIAAAQKLARDGFPDWVLLRRGDAWREDPGVRSGRSASEPSLMAPYGTAAPRPQLLGRGISLPWRGFRYLAFVGLDIYCSERDPGSPDFVSPQKGGSGLWTALGEGAEGHHLLVEDCAFRMTKTLALQNFRAPRGALHDIVFRRNLVLDSYPSGGHCQGMFAHGVSGMLLEENVFDHDGWSTNVPVTGGRATMFNHDTYFSECNDIVFRGNMFLRAASSGNKWRSDETGGSRNILIDDNLYVEGEIGLSIGGNTQEPLRFVNVTVINNVMLDIGRARPTGRTLAWYIDIMDWDGGLVANNCLLHQASDDVMNSYGIHVRGSSTRNVLIRGNVIHGIKSSNAGLILADAPGLRNVTVTQNAIQFPQVGSRLASAQGPMTGFVLAGNTYFSGREPGQWFRVDRGDCDISAWVQKTGERNPVLRRLTFPDPDRTVETYMGALGGQPTFEAFLAAVRAQAKGNWNPALTASAINDYIRAGFGMARLSVPAEAAR